MKALVVDDSRTIRVILRRILENLGFQVEEAADGDVALVLLAEGRPPDIVLLDWDMPNVDGIEVVQTLRRDPRFEPVKFVMVTKENRLHNVKTALAAGADEYIMKPFTEEVVREKLALVDRAGS